MPPRQREIARLRWQDQLRTAEIAGRLFLSEGTVRNYLSACIQKTAARNRAEALRIASDRGWL